MSVAVGFGSMSDLVSLTRAGTVSVREAVVAQLEQLHASDRQHHCVAWFDDDHAIRAAEDLDRQYVKHQVGALHGVPITVKDWIDVVGFPCAGETGNAVRRPEVDATVVSRLRAAGAVVIAKTVVWGPPPPAAGHAVHPLDSALAPGGSSTGEAIAIASGGSLVGIGSDSGGSIRLPASWCGIIGFKPTAGLIPTTGHYPRVGPMYDGRTQIGPLATSLDDVATLLAIMAGPDGYDGGVAPVTIPWGRPVEVDSMSFSVVSGETGGAACEDVVAAVERAAAVLESSGLRRVSWDEPWLDDAMDITRRYWQRRDQTGAEVDIQLRDWDTFRYRYLRGAQHVDVLLTPSTPTAAPPLGPVDVEEFRFTVPASLTGSPAVALPAGRMADGRPLSVQLVGRPWEDHRLLELAGLLERPDAFG